MKTQSINELMRKVTKENSRELLFRDAFMLIDASYSLCSEYFGKVNHITIRFQENEIYEFERIKEMELVNPGLYNDRLIYLVALLEGSEETISQLIPLPLSGLFEYLSCKQGSSVMFDEYYDWHLYPSLKKLGYHKFFSPKAPDFDEVEYENFYKGKFSEFWDVESYKDHEKIYIVPTNADKCFAPCDLPVYSIDEYNQQLSFLARTERLISGELLRQPETPSNEPLLEVHSPALEANG